MRDALEMEARDLMTPGVVSIADDASLSQVHRALRKPVDLEVLLEAVQGALSARTGTG